MSEPANGQESVSGPEPTSGMETGSDAGAPGDHLPDLPLDPSDRATLADLLDAEAADRAEAADGADAGAGARAEQPVEDDPAVVEAVEDDSPLPVAGGDGARGSDPDATDDVVFMSADDEKRG